MKENTSVLDMTRLPAQRSLRNELQYAVLCTLPRALSTLLLLFASLAYACMLLCMLVGNHKPHSVCPHPLTQNLLLMPKHNAGNCCAVCDVLMKIWMRCFTPIDVKHRDTLWAALSPAAGDTYEQVLGAYHRQFVCGLVTLFAQVGAIFATRVVFEYVILSENLHSWEHDVDR